MDNQTIGQIIFEHRKKKGLTQKALASQLCVTDKAVSKWERDIARPDINTVPKLAEILDVPAEHLLNIPIRPQAETNSILPVTYESEGIPLAVLENEEFPLITASSYIEDDYEREVYKAKARSLLLKGFAGFLIGFLMPLITSYYDGNSFLLPISLVLGFCFSGVVYGWELFGRLLDGWFIIGTIPVLIIAFFLRLTGSLLTGWIVYPFALLYNLAKAQKKNSFFQILFYTMLGLLIGFLFCFAILVIVLAANQS